MSQTSRQAYEGTSRYFREIIDCSNFWISLASLSLGRRFRLTHLGILWTMIQPLFFALTISLVFRYIFNQPIVDLSIYILSGITFWELFSQTVLGGAGSILDSGQFIKQRRLPLAIYPLQGYLADVAAYLITFVGLILWILVLKPSLFSAYWLMAVPNVALIVVCLFPIAIWSAVFGTLVRDFAEAARVLLTALWFLSPVFLDKTIFANPGIRVWDVANPVSNMLALIRDPMIYGHMPKLENYGVVILFGIVNYAIAVYALRRHERTLVYYL